MAPTPRGKSPSNMGQIMELARGMSDAQLADVLQGKSLDVPQFAAMTEAMGRKSLRNAVQGAQAQGEAHQPSLKDKLLAEDTAQQMPEDIGIAQIPAPNMESMSMAGGGIIAFDDGGEVPRFNGTQGSTPRVIPEIPSLESMKSMPRVIPEIPSLDYLSPTEKKSVLEKLKAAFNSGIPEGSMSKGLGSLGRNVLRPLVSLPGAAIATGGEYLSNAAANTMSSPMMESNRQALQDNSMLGALSGDTAMSSAIIDAANKGNEKEKVKNEAVAYESGFTSTPSLASEKDKQKTEDKQKTNPNVNLGSGVNPSAGVNSRAEVNPSAATLGGVDEEIAKYADKYSKMFPEAQPFVKRDNPFSAVKYEGDSADKTREQGLGAGLMMAASGLLKNPTFAGGLGDAMTALGNQGWITAKEVKAAQKDEREFNKDMAKASELYEQGQEEKAIKYATLAQHRQDKVMDTAINTLKAKTDLFTAQSDADYKKGSLALKAREIAHAASGGGGIGALLNLLKDPANMAIYQQMNEAKNPKLNAITPDAALKSFADLTNADITGKGFKKQHPTFESYYNSLKPNSAPQPIFLGYEPQ
jgi:hypothetical protein